MGYSPGPGKRPSGHPLRGRLHGAGHCSVAGTRWGRGDVVWHQDWFGPGTCCPRPHPAVEQVLASDPKTQICSLSSQELSFYATLLKICVKYFIR